MKPLTIRVPSAQSRVAAFTSDKHMRPIASGLKIGPVMRRARKALRGKEPLLVVIPRKNVTHIFWEAQIVPDCTYPFVSFADESGTIVRPPSTYLPETAKVDAYHIAVATVNGMDYLLTWNCTHIANAIMRPKLEMVCRKHGYEAPIICTPLELMEV
jgi:hypothetical protein